MIPAHPDPGTSVGSIRVELDGDVVSVAAVLKTTYWYSRDFYCDVFREQSRVVVVLRPKTETPTPNVRHEFISQALDFALRERIESRTSGVRDLLLAKAFSEAGVLEDAPNGVFGDVIEESKPDGMFKILNNG